MRYIDLTGQTFGRLTVLHRVPSRGKAKFLCRCTCGVEKAVQGADLRAGKQISCGCAIREYHRARHLTHGMTDTPEYEAWCHIKRRCNDPNEKRGYFAKGITVCDRWQGSFENFYADMGSRPDAKHSIDRIDNNGNYEPGNCRWATAGVQQNNKGSNFVLEHAGKSQTLIQWARETGIGWFTIHARVGKLGWPVERALTTPPRPMTRKEPR